jgi:adenylylsulfate reductase subunit B
VKICPQGAIAVRGYNDFVPMGGQVHPMRSSDSIMWTVKFRNGNMKRFKFPIRTTAEGAANAYIGEKGANLDDECLLLESELIQPTMLA